MTSAPLNEIINTLNLAVRLMDMEADDIHPDPVGNAIELVREAEESLGNYLTINGIS